MEPRPVSTPQELALLIDELTRSTWTLAAIAFLFDSGLADELREPRSVDELAALRPAMSRERIERCLGVAVARGVVAAEGGRYRLAPGALPALEPAPRTAMQGDYRSTLLQAAAYLRAAAAPGASGWRHDDPMILQAQGDSSSMFATALKHRLAPELGDLATRLAGPDARFLDIGAGVGALSISMCREFPQLRAVALDAAEAPLALARTNVARAELEDRVELRHGLVQDLRDEAAYDLVWLPGVFLGTREEVARAIDRVRVALRPGGWLLTPGLSSSIGEAQRAVWSMVVESWGGPVLAATDLERMVATAGLAARTLPGPSWVAMVAGQR